METAAVSRRVSEHGSRNLLVMLPGAHFNPSDFADHGFIDAVRARGLKVDCVTVELRSDDYLDASVVDRVHRTAIEPAMSRGYTEIWLLGISLGGMGALLYTRAHPHAINGIFLLAPFLATRGTIAEVVAAGGLAAWSPDEATGTASEHRLLAWLRSKPFARGEQPRVLLAHGAGDRYADASRLLYEQIPPERIVVTDGGHDWPTWADLWRRLLDTAPFTTHRIDTVRD